MIVKTKPIILAGLLLFIFTRAISQISIVGGPNYCTVRNNHVLKNEEAVFALHFGAAIRYYPFKNTPKISVQNEILFNRKGYQQNLDKNYVFQFNYVSLPIILNYAPVNYFSVNTGVEISGLLSTNIEQGTKTYNSSDFGIIFGMSCFEGKRVSLYSRITYGLIPMLDYESFDKLGNFTGKIHDLKNTSISIGLKISIYNEEIHLYK